MREHPLTETQQRILTWVAAYAHRQGRAPTHREVGEALALSKDAAGCHLRALIGKGYLVREGRSRVRSLRVPGLTREER